MTHPRDPAIAIAEARIVQARADALATLAELRIRLDPRVIAVEQASALTARFRSAGRNAVASIERNPAISLTVVAAFVAAVGLRLWMRRSRRDDLLETSE